MALNYKNITECNYKVITHWSAGQIAALIFLGSALILCPGCNSGGETEENTAAATNVPVAEYIGRADELFKQRDDLKNVRDGIELLKQVRQADRRNYEAAWKLSRLFNYVARYSPDEKEKEKAAEAGVETGKIATRVEPEKPDGYFWLGANLGEKAKQKQVTDGLGSLDDIRTAMNKDISRDPDYE